MEVEWGHIKTDFSDSLVLPDPRMPCTRVSLTLKKDKTSKALKPGDPDYETTLKPQSETGLPKLK